ncbi:hypothetical protein Tb927.8.2320 [Trypanosoma brucei brucei TREU927]|uniref:T. brucei spp.-specific protein n=1 Tax=Trypanosoma brucei brucei (strain 927/4 GUTat10.1) TaxID=185431 RepID=Q57XF7_TRYB2|nr:hypothetical protein Tb927.8.2320 [Trypanosoma brucei brucei TREU927]AAX69724.1 hypothetical protein Tb927.8.2320 [Trypanosoma brucei]AAZ12999.1 hypothetical protein Tb927.8.2320 [Trypanosoma brucei brucei TREU927]
MSLFIISCTITFAYFGFYQMRLPRTSFFLFVFFRYFVGAVDLIFVCLCFSPSPLSFPLLNDAMCFVSLLQPITLLSFNILVPIYGHGTFVPLLFHSLSKKRQNNKNVQLPVPVLVELWDSSCYSFKILRFFKLRGATLPSFASVPYPPPLFHVVRLSWSNEAQIFLLRMCLRYVSYVFRFSPSFSFLFSPFSFSPCGCDMALSR